MQEDEWETVVSHSNKAAQEAEPAAVFVGPEALFNVGDPFKKRESQI
jgi:hypothetical protein